MSTEVQLEFQPETITAIQDLIQANLDSASAFAEAAEQIEETNLSSLFRDLALQRRELAAALQLRISYNGQRPRLEGTWLGALQQAWIKLRGHLSSGDAYVVLCEAERAEDSIKRAYEDVLTHTLGGVMGTVLNNQYTIVKSSHDQIRQLRDQYKAR